MMTRGTKAIISGLQSTIAKQQEEIEYMRMSMFWEVQGPIAMQMAMNKTNANITKCQCVSCFMTGRAKVFGTENDACQFVPFFEECIKTLGIEVLQQPKQPFKSPCVGDDAVLLLRSRCVEAECHLVEVIEHTAGKVLRWADFKYGALVWRAKREDDQQIKKMVQLIAVLSGMIGPVAGLCDTSSEDEVSDEDGSSDEDGASDDSVITEVASNDAKKEAGEYI